MKRIIAYIVIAVLVLGGGYAYYRSKKLSETTLYNTTAIERGDVEQTITATGTLDTVSSINVGSEVSGVIQTIYVEHNTVVKKGQILAQINRETVMTQVDRAKASLQKSQASFRSAQASVGTAQAAVQRARADSLSVEARAKQAEAAVANARAAVSNAQAGVSTAQATVRKAQAECANAKLNFERQDKLRKQDLIAQNTRDDAYTTYLSTQASLDSARSSLQAAQATYTGSKSSLEAAILSHQGAQADAQAANISVTSAEQSLASAEANLTGAQADVEQAQASLDSSQVDLSKTSIRSPIDGIVLSVLVSEGQTVAAQFQAPQLFVLAKNLQEMQVTTLVDEADIGLVRKGNTASFTVDAWSDETFTGTVTEVRKASSTTNNVVTYPVIVHTNNDSLKLMPGMTATVVIAVSKVNDTLLVPSTAMRFKPDEGTVSNADELKKLANADDAKASPAVVASPATSSASPSPAPTANATSKVADGGVQQSSSKYRVIYTEDKDNPGKVIGHRVLVGVTDGTNSQLLGDDLKEGDKVVTSAMDAKEAAEKRGHGPRGPM